MKRSVLVVLIFIMSNLSAQTATSFSIESVRRKLEEKFPPPYAILPFNGNVYRLIKNGKIGFIKGDGRIITEPVYDYVWHYRNRSGPYAVMKDRRWGYLDSLGNLIVPLKYDFTSEFSEEGFGIVFINGTAGAVNSSGALVAEPVYEAVYSGGVIAYNGNYWIAPKNHLCVKLKDKFGLIAGDGKVIAECSYEKIEDFKEGLALVTKDGKDGFIDKRGHLSIPIEGKYSRFQNGYAIVYAKGKTGYIDRTGKVAFEPTFDDGLLFNEDNTATIKMNGKWGVITKSGKITIPPVYDIYVDFRKGDVAPVKMGSKYGFIDKTGKTILPFDYDEVIAWVDGNYEVRVNNKSGVINQHGQWIIPTSYGRISGGGQVSYIYDSKRFVNGITFINKRDESIPMKSNSEINSWGVINRYGKLILPCEYGDIKIAGDSNIVEVHTLVVKNYNWASSATKFYRIQNGLLANEIPNVPETNKTKDPVTGSMLFSDVTGKYGLKDRNGKLLVPNKYDEPSSLTEENYTWFPNGLVMLRLNNKWGYLDGSGKETIPFNFDYISAFESTVAVVALNNTYYYIDKKGKMAFPNVFQKAYRHMDNLAAVQIDNKWGFIDNTGAAIIPLKYEEAENFHCGLAKVKINGKWGFINKTGDIAIDVVFDEVQSFESWRQKVRARINGKDVLLDMQGRQYPDRK